MRLTRSSRWYAAVIAMLCMLFMQLAVAAYACPKLTADAGSGQEQAAGAVHEHAKPCCDKPDPEQPSLCHAHGQAVKQSLDKPDRPPVQPFVAAGLAIPLAPIHVHDGRARVPADIASLARTTAPPLAIRNCCLRI